MSVSCLRKAKKNRCPFSFLMTTQPTPPPPNIPPNPPEIKGVLIFSWLMKTHWVSQPKQPVGWRWSILYKFLLRQKPGSLGPMLIPQDLLGITLKCGKMNNQPFWEKIWLPHKPDDSCRSLFGMVVQTWPFGKVVVGDLQPLGDEKGHGLRMGEFFGWRLLWHL